MAYQGLPRGTFAYLAALAANNDRGWFEAHRDEYERLWLGAGLDLIAALEPLCRDMAPRLLAVPKLNASLRRIHRDTRFSTDKSPYKPHLHLILSAGEPFNKVAGMHIVLSPEGLAFGAGRFEPPPEVLGRLRARICDDSERAGLLAAIASAEAVGSALDPPDLARVPKGFAAEAEWEVLLRRKSLICRTPAALAPPDWLFSPDAPHELARITHAHLPLLAWLGG